MSVLIIDETPPITLHDETSPAWLRDICPVPTLTDLQVAVSNYIIARESSRMAEMSGIGLRAALDAEKAALDAIIEISDRRLSADLKGADL